MLAIPLLSSSHRTSDPLRSLLIGNTWYHSITCYCVYLLMNTHTCSPKKCMKSIFMFIPMEYLHEINIRSYYNFFFIFAAQQNAYIRRVIFPFNEPGRWSNTLTDSLERTCCLELTVLSSECCEWWVVVDSGSLVSKNISAAFTLFFSRYSGASVRNKVWNFSLSGETVGNQFIFR